jgi:hypothetical protein
MAYSSSFFVVVMASLEDQAPSALAGSDPQQDLAASTSS